MAGAAVRRGAPAAAATTPEPGSSRWPTVCRGRAHRAGQADRAWVAGHERSGGDLLCGPSTVWYSRGVPSARYARSAAEILRSVPPRDRAMLLQLGLDLDDPVDAAFFVSGVRAADEAIAAQKRWERENGLG